MEFKEAVKTCLSKSFKLDGRASRSEYWYFVLFQFCLYMVGIFIMSMSAMFQTGSGLGVVGGLFVLVGGIFLLATLACVPASICAQVRRLHDVGKPSVYWFINLIPFGSLVLLYFCVLPSVGDNEFGKCPND